MQLLHMPVNAYQTPSDSNYHENSEECFVMFVSCSISHMINITNYHRKRVGHSYSSQIRICDQKSPLPRLPSIVIIHTHPLYFLCGALGSPRHGQCPILPLLIIGEIIIALLLQQQQASMQ